MRRARGFVLLNALVLVAALSAIALVLVERSTASRTRASAGQEAAQAGLYLDAMEALFVRVLNVDQAASETDTLAEGWARRRYDVAVDRGRVAGQLADLQGRFNLNALTDPNDAASRASFGRLCAGLGLSSRLADAIAGFVAPGGPTDPRPYAARAVPLRPVGGALVSFDDLRAIPDLSRADLARLRPYVAVLPPGTALNVNTASRQVLLAMLPEIGVAGVGRLLSERVGQPFASVTEFLTRAAAVAPPEALQSVDAARFDVASHWFQGKIAASLGATHLARQVVLQRVGATGRAVIVRRVAQGMGQGADGAAWGEDW